MFNHDFVKQPPCLKNGIAPLRCYTRYTFLNYLINVAMSVLKLVPMMISNSVHYNDSN